MLRPVARALSPIRRAGQLARESGVWHPQTARYLTRQLSSRDGSRRPDQHLRAASDWLRRAQDATGDGGVSWGYRLASGWAPSYPETTGYIIPTYLRLADHGGGEADRRRAGRAIEFLAGVRLPDGSFPGRRIDENRAEPSIFNTAQILHGLTAWHAATGDGTAGDLAADAAAWLVAQQEDDGSWRRFTYLGLPVAYVAHGSCWLAEYGQHADDRAALDAAERHLDWALAQRDPLTGWFDLAGFTAADHRQRIAVTHTIAYTIWGVLDLGVRLGRPDAVAAAAQAAAAVGRVIRAQGSLPGLLDSSWTGRAGWECLTGNAQMALIWFRLAEIGSDGGDLTAAGIALDRVRAAQSLTSRDPGINGGIAGSSPAWGAYLRFVLPNWAAKFSIDAFLVEAARANATQGGGGGSAPPAEPTTA